MQFNRIACKRNVIRNNFTLSGAHDYFAVVDRSAAENGLKVDISLI